MFCRGAKKGVTLKLFIHFENDGNHQDGKAFGWFDVPNERICPVPKESPKPRAGVFPYPSSTYSSSGAAGTTFNVFSTEDERSYIKGRNSAGYGGGRAVTHRPKPKPLRCIEPKISMDSDHLYALTGVVIHSGTVHAGHYHVFLKDFMREGQWRRKDVETDDETKGLYFVSW